MNQHEEFMMLALKYSQQSLPGCRPNPPVGCVIVHDNRVVSSGCTQLPGHHHAEIDALSKLTYPINECEMFVTLEPCSFEGRTPSCARTLAKLRPKHIYIGMEDPHPRNRGAGLKILYNAGVTYTLGLGRENIENFLLPYLVKS